MPKYRIKDNVTPYPGCTFHPFDSRQQTAGDMLKGKVMIAGVPSAPMVYNKAELTLIPEGNSKAVIGIKPKKKSGKRKKTPYSGKPGFAGA